MGRGRLAAAVFFCLVFSLSAAAFAAVGDSRTSLEQRYGGYHLVQATDGRFYTAGEWGALPGRPPAKSYGYMIGVGEMTATVWAEYDRQATVFKETVILDGSIRVRDVRERFGELYAGIATANSTVFIIRAYPRDQLGVVCRDPAGRYRLVRFFVDNAADRTKINMHSRIRGFEISAITAAAVQAGLAASTAGEYGGKPPTDGAWVKTSNFFRPELYFSEKLAPRRVSDMVVIHHTKIADMSVADIHKLHLKNGWAGIGYHKVILPDGTVADGRPEKTVGAHARGSNARSIGIALVGDFDINLPTAPQMDAAVALTLKLMSKYNIPLANVMPHRAVSDDTTCPGLLFPWEEFKQALAAGTAGPR
jgi:hypothetical protein